MRRSTLILRTLAYFWRSHVAVAAGVAVATAVLAGALMVGDSVSGSLADLVDQRLGPIDHVLVGPYDFPSTLAGRLGGDEGFTEDFAGAWPAIVVRGSLSRDPAAGGPRRAAGARVLAAEAESLAVPAEQCIVNDALAEDLSIRAGERVELRVVAVEDVPRDAALGSRAADVRVLSLTVVRIASEPGVRKWFNLEGGQRVPRNCWVNFTDLADALGRPGRANCLFVSARPHGRSAEAAARLDAALGRVATLEDYGLRFRDAVEPAVSVLESRRIFLPPPLVAAGRRVGRRLGVAVTAVSTHLANTIERQAAAGRPARRIPYSVVSGMGRPPGGALGEEEICLTRWAADAEDLAAREGDRVRLSFYRRTPDGRMVETDGGASFRVARIVPTAGIGADHTLTPPFEGITDAASINDWEPPADLKLDLRRIRPRDEQYWEDHKAAPKAFVSLAAARRLWGSALGGLTSLRVPADRRAEFAAALRNELVPASMGLAFRPIRAFQSGAAGGSTDFGQLFIGFSFFLICSAAMLVGLLFRLSIERRGAQIGLLQAIGFTPQAVRRQQAGVGMILAVGGAAVGVGGAVGYAAVMMHGLNTWWSAAVGGGFLRLHVRPLTLGIGYVAGVLVSLLSIWWAVWRVGRTVVARLLAGGRAAVAALRRRPGRVGGIVLLASTAAAVVLLGLWLADLWIPAPLAFFGAGVALLVGGLTAWRRSLSAVGRRAMGAAGPLPMLRLGIRNAGRHAGRSVLTAALIASACFVIVTVASLRRAAPTDPDRPDSGAGGYALIAEADLPLLHNPADAEGRRQLAMASRDAAFWPDTAIEPLRVSDGEDLSCLNLYQPRRPRIVSVPPSMVARGGFRFAAAEGGATEPWALLEGELPDGQVPVFADAAAAEWTLHLGLGDTVQIDDEAGRPVRLRLVGLLSGSIFQGELLMGEGHFRRLFPSEAGYRQFLIRAPAAARARVKAALEQDLADFGVVVDRTADRLAAFAAVEGTYMSTFQSLGSLGLLLGTAGVAVVLLRGLAERRAELALLLSLGFRRAALLTLVLAENGYLLGAGLLCGSAAALVAAVPQIVASDGGGNWLGVAITLLSLLAVGLGVLLGAAWGGLRLRPARDLHAQ
jgi:hypothetical protein